MDKFLWKGKLLKLIHDKLENLNRTLTSKEIELVVKILPAKKTPDDMALQMISKKKSKEE